MTRHRHEWLYRACRLSAPNGGCACALAVMAGLDPAIRAARLNDEADITATA
jgi:hypothetical protein